MLQEGSAWTALGFVLGAAAGAALMARIRRKSILAGRRCAHCGASLSLWPAVPLLSWLAVRPSCAQCGEAPPRLHSGFEAAVVVIGVVAILLAPRRVAVIVAAAGWALLFALVAWRQR